MSRYKEAMPGDTQFLIEQVFGMETLPHVRHSTEQEESHAVLVESSEALDVRERPGDGEAVGEAHP